MNYGARGQRFRMTAVTAANKMRDWMLPYLTSRKDVAAMLKDGPACRKCMNWKRKDSEYGVCWKSGHDPVWVGQQDVCEKFAAKIIRVTP